MNARKHIAHTVARQSIFSIVAVSTLALGGAVLAQTPATAPNSSAAGSPTTAPMRGHGGGMQPEAVTQRLAQVKDALRLSPDQQGAWSSYEATVKRAAEGHARMHESMQSARSTPDAMDDARVAMMKQNAQSAEEINNARKALVAVLSPEQKSTFDKLRPGAKRGERAHGGHGAPGAAPQRQPS
jgi:periplasmic protein CpxP/Spy